MTIYDAIKNYDEDQLVEFLYHFSNDVIDNFGRFAMPDKESIREFLNKEVPTKE